MQHDDLVVRTFGSFLSEILDFCQGLSSNVAVVPDHVISLLEPHRIRVLSIVDLYIQILLPHRNEVDVSSRLPSFMVPFCEYLFESKQTSSIASMLKIIPFVPIRKSRDSAAPEPAIYREPISCFDPDVKPLRCFPSAESGYPDPLYSKNLRVMSVLRELGMQQSLTWGDVLVEAKRVETEGNRDFAIKLLCYLDDYLEKSIPPFALATKLRQTRFIPSLGPSQASTTMYAGAERGFGIVEELFHPNDREVVWAVESCAERKTIKSVWVQANLRKLDRIVLKQQLQKLIDAYPKCKSGDSAGRHFEAVYKRLTEWNFSALQAFGRETSDIPWYVLRVHCGTSREDRLVDHINSD